MKINEMQYVSGIIFLENENQMEADKAMVAKNAIRSLIPDNLMSL